MVVSFDAPVDTSVIEKAKAELKRVMNLDRIEMDFTFPPESLDTPNVPAVKKKSSDSDIG